MKKFEYTKFSYSNLSFYSEIIKELNEIGKLGWDVIEIDRIDYGFSGKFNLNIWAKREVLEMKE